jgi:PIN domain nuclease of toxin-antitoxin system
MKLLLDTHALMWWLAGDKSLSRKAREAIQDEDNDVYVSAASAWEIATKFRLGKLPGAEPLVPDIPGIVASQDFSALPIALHHAQRAGTLSGQHRDPFDRMLIAQSQLENMTLISNESLFDSYGITRLW